jgi:hypothetical protein
MLHRLDAILVNFHITRRYESVHHCTGSRGGIPVATQSPSSISPGTDYDITVDEGLRMDPSRQGGTEALLLLGQPCPCLIILFSYHTPSDPMGLAGTII